MAGVPDIQKSPGVENRPFHSLYSFHAVYNSGIKRLSLTIKIF